MAPGGSTRKAQKLTRHVHDHRAVLERDERPRSIKLPFALHVRDEYAGVAAWVLLGVVRAPPRAALAADPTPRAMVRWAVYYPSPIPILMVCLHGNVLVVSLHNVYEEYCARVQYWYNMLLNIMTSRDTFNSVRTRRNVGR